ncbi:hypothetical protein SAMN05444411_102384 [Lutibacter oricola]|uniref:Uncharacterized protein n=1 Tax=Lutibacter oricola TaxID=762486 RepID=A0A1H2X6T8_9FLAO|nr:hypothetical protein [Lutibacter oricola]SDW88505.1 hypothetical protein SAMN05444411_102384 [Lutibacter oricola]
MYLDKIIAIVSFTIPSIITGLIAYFFFLKHTSVEEKRIKISLLKENKKHSLPQKLQAYERMTLFLERMNPSKLLIRVTSVNNDKNAYIVSVVNTIEQELEHNLTQQIYVSDECWNVIIAAKNATIHLINMVANDATINTAEELREAIIKKVIEKGAPSSAALIFVKNEVKDLL